MTTFKFGNRYVNVDRIVMAEYSAKPNELQSDDTASLFNNRVSVAPCVRLALGGFQISDPTELASVISFLESSRLRDF